MTNNNIFTCESVRSLRHHFKMGESLDNAQVEKLLLTAEFATGELEHILLQEAEAIEATVPTVAKPKTDIERIRALKRLCEALLGEKV